MDTLLLITPPLIPAATAAAYLVLGWRRATTWLGATAAAGLLAAAIALADAVTDTGPRTALGGLLRADALSAFMLIVIGTVALLATLASPGYLAADGGNTDVARRYAALVQAFIATMTAAVLAANLGLLWVAIEATTIVTAFLVGHHRTRRATEAAWKYVVVCSVGIALAFLGTVLLNFAAAHAHADLDFTSLTTHAAALDPDVTRIAVALLVFGFGAKAGLAPLHAWLPDAHSQAPPPVSALMSGVLLSVAFYAVLRVKTVADLALGPGFTRRLLLIAALASLTVAAALLLTQREYKRMLAYSSMEHMGLLALGAAAGSRLAIAAVLLHVLGHGLGKSVLFIGSGHILRVTGSSSTNGVRGLAATQPALAGMFGFGVLALLGLPPFSLFASQLGIARAGFTAGLGWAVAGALLLTLVIAAALVVHTGRMLLGTPPPDIAVPVASMATSAAVPLVAGLVACAALGVTIWPLHSLLDAAAAIGAVP